MPSRPSWTIFSDHRVTHNETATYTVELRNNATSNITRMDNALARLPEHLEKHRARLTDLYRQMVPARAEITKPFAFEAELQRKSARLTELGAGLNLSGKAAQEQTSGLIRPH